VISRPIRTFDRAWFAPTRQKGYDEMCDKDLPVVIEIDADKCIGTGICEAIAPHAAELDDEGIARTTGALLPLSIARDMRDNCPSLAIAIASK
jgi:ferredoxin